MSHQVVRHTQRVASEHFYINPLQHRSYMWTNAHNNQNNIIRGSLPQGYFTLNSPKVSFGKKRNLFAFSRLPRNDTT